MLRYIDMRGTQLRPLIAIENVRLRRLHVVVQNEIFLDRVLYALDRREETLIFLRESPELASHLMRNKIRIVLVAFARHSHRLQNCRGNLIEIKWHKSPVALLDLWNHFAIANRLFRERELRRFRSLHDDCFRTDGSFRSFEHDENDYQTINNDARSYQQVYSYSREMPCGQRYCKTLGKLFNRSGVPVAMPCARAKPAAVSRT